jgi:membrane protein DedA with SNARE-associated domain
MADDDSPEYGTLVTAALLILALAFAGYWIYSYVGDQGTPLAPWFAVAAIAIVVLGILNYARRRRTP